MANRKCTQQNRTNEAKIRDAMSAKNIYYVSTIVGIRRYVE